MEIGNDMLRRRLDSIVKCVTLTDANGVLERIYVKDDSTIRREVKVKNTTIAELEALWSGGVTSYNIVQGVATMINEFQENSEKLDKIVSIFSSMMTLERERLKREHK
ncbi:MAG: hypothetical protein JSV20_02150 [Candidatus Bathyarchaeota archaeon]|nr:MAG: hypothetical protein JSV20_02150 [Candidatus Bathyarchaeota archaeon]